MKALLTFSLFLSMTTASIAIECKDSYDLRPQMGPIRDQDTVGWCYAFSAADQITNWLYRHKKELPSPYNEMDFTKKENMVSALAVATDYYQTEGSIASKIKEKFHPLEVFELNKQKKEIEEELQSVASKMDQVIQDQNNPQQLLFCFQNKDWGGCAGNKDFWKKLEPQLNKYASHLQKIEQKKYDLFQFIQGGDTERAINAALKNGIYFEKDVRSDNLPNNGQLFAYFDNLSYKINTADNLETVQCQVALDLESILPSSSFETLLEVVQKSFKLENDPLYSLIDNPALKNKINIKAKIINDSDPNSKYPWALFDQVGRRRAFTDDQLKAGKIVEIQYYPSGLIEPFVMSFNRPVQHSSTLVGKTCLRHQEYYILRNSWGPDQCLQTRNKIIYDNIDKEGIKNKSEMAEYQNCKNNCFKSNFKTQDEKTECYIGCFNKNLDSFYSVIDLSFDCDEQGNYLVKSEKLFDNVFTQKLTAME